MGDKACFYSVGRQRSAKIKIKRSVFICTMDYAGSIEAAKTFISRISKENKTATHNCWAYILGEKGGVFHCSDAGEPSGTAGKPMLNMLQSHGMTQIAAVVTRHYGGVKLGVRGLIEAYSQSVQTTLTLGKLKKMVKTVLLAIEVTYEFNDMLLNQIKPYIILIKDTSYTDKIVHFIEIEVKDQDLVNRLLSEYQSQGMLTFTRISQSGS